MLSIQNTQYTQPHGAAATTALTPNTSITQMPRLRMHLAQRAKKRRLALGLKVDFVAQQMGVAASRLYQMERCLLSTPDDEVEAAWEKCLGIPAGWLRQADAPQTHGSGADPANEVGDFAANGAMAFFNLDAAQSTATLNYQSVEDRIKMAVRAKERRREMGVMAKTCAQEIGLNLANFGAYERCLRKFPDAEVERLWEKALEVPQGWIRDLDMPTPEAPRKAANIQDEGGAAVNPGSLATHCATVADEIIAVGAWLSRRAPGRRTTDITQLEPSEVRWVQIFAQRYGVLGEEASILESVGNRFGLTRERIRQIVHKMTSRAVDLRIETPRLDELAAKCADMSAQTIQTVNQELSPMLGQALSIESAQRFGAEILGKKVANIAPVQDVLHILDPVWSQENALAIKTARSAAFKMIRGSGAANIHFVCGMVSDITNEPVTAKFIRTAVSLVPGFEWLVEHEGWFWFGHDNGDNRLDSVVKKIMAAAECKVDVDDIYLAFGRSSREKYRGDDSQKYAIDAPIKVIQKILEKTPWLTCVQYNDFFAHEESQLVDVLSDVETEILKVIQSQNGVAAKFEIDRRVSAALGVTPMAINAALGKSPCFIQPARGLYSVCGRDIEPAALDQAFEAVIALTNRGTTGVQDDEGNFIFKFELSPYQVKHKFIGLPSVLIQKIPPGPYAFENQATPALVTARASGLMVLSKMMDAVHDLGAQVGTLLSLTINPQSRTARLKVIDSLV